MMKASVSEYPIQHRHNVGSRISPKLQNYLDENHRKGNIGSEKRKCVCIHKSLFSFWQDFTKIMPIYLSEIDKFFRVMRFMIISREWVKTLYFQFYQIIQILST